MLSIIVPNKERPEEWIYNEKKTAKQFMITQTASSIIDNVAKELNISRSEVLERAIRCGGMSHAKNFNPSTGKCSND
jgi:hypothetical protein